MASAPTARRTASSAADWVSDDYDYLFKVVVVGDSGVGKSSLVSRFALDTYDPNFIATIGVDFRVTGTTVGDKKVKLQIWDTAGQERFAPIVTTYYRGAHAVVCVYDRTDTSTLQAAAGKWMQQVHDYARKHAPVLLVGNKADLVPPSAAAGGAETAEPAAASSGRPSSAEVDELAEAVMADSPHADRMFAHVTTSAKDGSNVTDAFAQLAAHLMAQEASATAGAAAKGTQPSVDLRGKPVGLGDEDEPSCCKVA